MRTVPPFAGLTRLQPGMEIVYAGERCRVLMVNDCRALVQPIAQRRRTVTPQTGRYAGKTRTFTEPRKKISISPNAEVDILAGTK